MKRLLLTAASLFALTMAAQPATAADMPRPVTKAPAMVAAPMFDWSGFYVGVAAGYGRTSSGLFYFDGAPFDLTESFRADGAIVGGTAGLNWQRGPWIAGIEGDYSWADIDGRGAGEPPFTAFPGRTEVQSLGTLRARFGYAIVPTIWLYATGGVAWAEIKNQVNSGGLEVSARSTKSSWTAGGGVEASLAGGWSAKLEYLYAEFGRTRTGCAPGAEPIECDPEVFAEPRRLHIVRGGLNYRFATGKGAVGKTPAVVTKY